jgi:hypothetical protein
MKSGCMGEWMYGREDVWESGCMGERMYGRADVWESGCRDQDFLDLDIS